MHFGDIRAMGIDVLHIWSAYWEVVLGHVHVCGPSRTVLSRETGNGSPLFQAGIFSPSCLYKPSAGNDALALNHDLSPQPLPLSQVRPPYHLGVEGADGRAVHQQLRDLCFVLLQAEL